MVLEIHTLSASMVWHCEGHAVRSALKCCTDLYAGCLQKPFEWSAGKPSASSKDWADQLKQLAHILLSIAALVDLPDKDESKICRLISSITQQDGEELVVTGNTTLHNARHQAALRLDNTWPAALAMANHSRL